MRKILIMLAATLFASHFCFAQNVLSEAEQQALQKLTADLISSDKQERNLAADTLRASRGILVEGVQRSLNITLKGDKKEMKVYDSSFHRICQVVETWRIEQATGPGLLLDYIDVRLDPKTFPPFGLRGTTVYYPAARALVATRSSRLNNDLMLAIRYPVPITDSKLLIVTWILQESNGNEIAQLLLGNEIANTERWMENVGVKEDVGRDSLLKALALLKAKDGVQLPLTEVAPMEKR